MQRSLRLFLGLGPLIPSKQAFPDDDSRISIGIAMHLACWAIHQRRTRGVSFDWFSRIVTSNQAPTTSTLPARISWTDTARDDPFVPRLVLRVGEDLPPQPVRAFFIPAPTVLALLWLEVS